MSFTVGPRIEFCESHYPRIRYYHDGREYYFYIHRLVAYAHGELDYPFVSYDKIPIIEEGGVTFGTDERVVHHENKKQWDNRPVNLITMTEKEHTQVEPHTKNL